MSPPYHQSSYSDRPEFRRRAPALLLAIIFHLAIIILLLRQAYYPPQPKKEDSFPVSFTLAPEPKKEPAKAQQKAAAAPRSPNPQVKPNKPVEKPVPDLPFVTMTRKDMAAADISRLPPRAEQGAGDDSGPGKDAATAYGPGDGPGGMHLVNVDWYRRPTNAELSPYLPADAPANGWGEVACKMIEDYHVENCQAIGESPIGSGFARAVRLAAWQFLVEPPKVNGRPQIGTWVRIRIDYTQGRPR